MEVMKESGGAHLLSPVVWVVVVVCCWWELWSKRTYDYLKAKAKKVKIIVY